MYKEASALKLRFSTPKGNLSVEQLWDLSVEELDTIAVALDEEYNSTKTKSFLTKKTSDNKKVKLKLDIALDILNTKQTAAEEALAKKEAKAHNEKIERLIEAKKEESLAGKSVEELEKMLIK